MSYLAPDPLPLSHKIVIGLVVLLGIVTMLGALKAIDLHGFPIMVLMPFLLLWLIFQRRSTAADSSDEN